MIRILLASRRRSSSQGMPGMPCPAWPVALRGVGRRGADQAAEGITVSPDGKYLSDTRSTKRCANREVPTQVALSIGSPSTCVHSHPPLSAPAEGKNLRDTKEHLRFLAFFRLLENHLHNKKIIGKGQAFRKLPSLKDS